MPRSKSKRTALDAQPFPQRAPKSRTATKRSREEQQIAVAEGRRLVQWLNASRGTASEKRVVFLLEEIVKLSDGWGAHVTVHPLVHPGGRVGFDEDRRKLVQRHHQLNELLCRYAFRPRVTYRALGGNWIFGMVPDENRNWFTTSIRAATTSEPDAVMSMLRLAQAGKLDKIVKCELCRRNWVFAIKRTYKFCGDECRETSYLSAPGYHARKARNQTAYRERQKKKEENEEREFRRHWK